MVKTQAEAVIDRVLTANFSQNIYWYGTLRKTSKGVQTKYPTAISFSSIQF